MRTHSRQRRPGFTLMELLVVIGIILVLSTLALMITPKFADNQRTTRGADQLQGWIFVAKQRAYRDQVPRGVRLVRSATNPNHVSEIVFIERPEAMIGTTVQVPGDPSDPTNFRKVFIPGVRWDLNDIVLQGDFFQLNQYETAPYNVHLISQPPTVATVNNQQGTMLTLASDVGGRIDATAPTAQLFQIIRQARPMVGESPMYLPRDVVIDLDPNSEGSSYLPGMQPTDLWYDVLFTERGQVTGIAGSVGKVILRVRQNADPNPNFPTVYDKGEQILIAIYTRTGRIGAYHLNLDQNANPNPPATPVLADPYLYVREGGSTGL